MSKTCCWADWQSEWRCHINGSAIERPMIEWLRFAFIIVIAALEHIAYETVLSFNTTRDFVRYRVRWILRDKLKTLWPGPR
jgi:hypothetical protein